MKQEEINEGSELICKFMEYNKHDGFNDIVNHGDYDIIGQEYYKYSRQQEENVETCVYSLNFMKFHKSLDWLIPVLNKIKHCGGSWLINSLSSAEMYSIDISGSLITFNHNSNNIIESCFKSCVDFIKWYFENKKIN